MNPRQAKKTINMIQSEDQDVLSNDTLKEKNLDKSGYYKFDTGAVRSEKGIPYHLLSPIALKRWANAYAEGAPKYGEYNCELGMSITGLLNHAIEHLRMYFFGDRSEDHLGHAMWNIGMAIHSEELWPELNKDLRGPNCSLTEEIRENLKKDK